MRFTTLASAAVLALSATVLVQVGSAPEEDKLAANDSGSTNQTAPAENAAEPEPSAPSTALVNSVEREPK